MTPERALRSITRLHARSSTARGWYGLTSAAAEAPIVTGKRGTSGCPARHRITILPQLRSFVKPKFKLFAFPLEKVPASLRAPRAISQRQGAYKIELLYGTEISFCPDCSLSVLPTKARFCIMAHVALPCMFDSLKY